MSEETETQVMPEPDPEPGRSTSAPRKLLKSRRDRMIIGVAGGLGDYFQVDPVIVRIAFVVATFFGGAGVAAYIAMALFVPSEPAEGDVPRQPVIERSRWLAFGVGAALVVLALSWGIFEGPWFGIGFIFPPLLFAAIVVGAISIARGGGAVPRMGWLGTLLVAATAFLALGLLAISSAWAGATGHGVAVAVSVIAIGGLLIVAAFRGGARWLVAPALVLALPLGAVSAADISFGDGVGDREYRPASLTAIPAEGYELGVGRLVIDLRDADWTQRTRVDLPVDLGVGQLVVAVPENVCVVSDVQTRAGHLQVAGDEADGVDVSLQANAGASASPRLALTGEVDVGEMLVVNDASADLDRLGRRFQDSLDDGERRSAMRDACAGDPAQVREARG